MKSLITHYRNKYPNGGVHASSSTLQVTDHKGRLRVVLEKDGNGDWKCVSEEKGALDRHDLSPIPKSTRAWKLYKDGRIAPAEEHAEREPAGRSLASQHGGKVPSEKELAEAPKAPSENKA